MHVELKDSDHFHPKYEGITGIILAGGKSTRYGRNKAFERIDGTPIIERVVDTMGSVFQKLIIITNTPLEYAHLGVPMFEDIIKGLGPIGGIYTGLDVISNAAGFFVACDMPFLNPNLIHEMVEVLGDFDAVVPKIDWKLESLHALYSKRCLLPIKKLIDAGEYQVIKLFERVRMRYLVEDEIRAMDPHLRSFFNVNRPEELVKACHIKNGAAG
ncbi:MAG: molybdenum cofactor guanylyltransferase [Pseudomonadota bacterium]